MPLRSTVKAHLITTFLIGSLTLGGCAFANKGSLHLSRHISLGQELIDLKRALDEEAITPQEYLVLKAKVMQSADSVDVVELVDKLDGADD